MTTNTKANTKPKEATVKKATSTKSETTVDRSNHPLAHLIPNRELYGEQYISRSIGGHTDLEILAHAFKERHNVLLYGPTGSAKTSCVYAFGAQNGLPVVNVPCNGAAEPRLFIGGWTPQADGSLDFVAGELLQAVLHGGIIYLDEVNFLPPKISAYIHGLLDKRRVLSVNDAKGSSIPSTIQAHKECFIVAAFNPDYHGTRPLNQAFRNRFKYQLSFPYDNEIESELVNSPSLLELANSLRVSVQTGNITTPISTNLLFELEEVNEDLGFDFALNNFLNHFPEDEAQVVREVLVTYAEKIYADLNNDDEFASSEFAIGKKVSAANQQAVQP